MEYTDAHYGPRSGHFVSHERAGQERNRCFGLMLTEAAKAHGVPPEVIFESLGSNRQGIDLAINLPFFLLYALAASIAARRIWRSQGAAMVLLAGLACGMAGLLLGELWSTAAGGMRIGTGHLSYRVERLPYARHSMELFAVFVVVFWLTALAVKLRTAETR